MIQVQISAMAHGGSGLARHAGKVLFLPYVVPGEVVLAEVTEERTRYSRARAVEITTPSPDRVEPRCPHFGTCGGCQWQHIAYERQLTLREEILRSQLTRIAHLTDPPVKPTLPVENPWCYRNHVQLHLDEDGRPGFLDADRHIVVPIEECHTMHPLLWDLFSSLEIDFPDLERVSLRAGTSTGEQMVILETTGDVAPGVELDLPISCVLLLPDGTPVTYVGESYVTETVSDRSLRISATSFFQVNTSQVEQLLTAVTRCASPQGNEVLLDLYCGVGTFGLSLSDKVSKVIGIDSSDSAIEDARFNSQGTTNVRFLQGAVEELLPSLEESIDLAIVDPPRQGLSKSALAALVAHTPPKVIYVSCDPATLARDIDRMVQSGYELLEVQPVDMFPQTYHVETVALLRLDST
ncbi:MAG TPA: 23S rRNA (uracil(1939)-C(5))-methyltransferase RlmD [Anaerolineae bacterium]|nr:23S rRNA (uracil(1939)-C(5))-methyltransferase RlmD [Anaerolineae bacterium]